MPVLLLTVMQCSSSREIHVNINGNDETGDGSYSKPWRSLKHAISNIPANDVLTIRLSAGTFIEDGQIDVPAGISIEGAGKKLTIIKSAEAFHHYPDRPGYSFSKFLMRLQSPAMAAGNQRLKDFSIDGDNKKLHGAILIENVSNVLIENVLVRNTNFNGIWLLKVNDSRLTGTEFINCSWSGETWSNGALNVGHTENVEIDNCKISEETGYGIKALSPDSVNSNKGLRIHDCHITVHPKDKKGKSNIAVELWKTHLEACEIYNCYMDNDLSIVNNEKPLTGKKAIRVYKNTFDMSSRANGSGYGIELTLNEVEIDNNYFISGRHGVVNWGHACYDWEIHHNVFYGIQSDVYPGEIIRSQKGGLHKLKFNNNTVEFEGNRTTNLISIYGGKGADIEIKNNLVINSNTAYSHYPNRFFMVEKDVVVDNLVVENNLCVNLSVPNLPGNYAGNITLDDPKIKKKGQRPFPYYEPDKGSPLINGGIDVGLPFKGEAPDIGAFEIE